MAADMTMNSITSILGHDQRGDRDEDHGYSSTGDETRFLTWESDPSFEPERTVATSPRRTGRMLLATKLTVPPVRSDTVPRPRLLHKLAQGTRRRLTLVAAAAGSGKTTLVSSWLRRHATAVAWVSLDAADNDPIRWLMYVLTAVNNVAPHIGEAALAALDANQPLETAAGITSVLNDVAKQTDPVTLVLDDYYVITNDAVHMALRMLI